MDPISQKLATLISNYTDALIADSLNPQPTYSLDGEAVSQDEWRDALMRFIMNAQLIINSRNPYWIRTRAYARC